MDLCQSLNPFSNLSKLIDKELGPRDKEKLSKFIPRDTTYTPNNIKPSSLKKINCQSNKKWFIKDHRPINSKEFQTNCFQTLSKFLVCQRFPFPISTKSILSPTRNEFLNVINYLF